MKERKVLFEGLKNRLVNFVKTDCFFLLSWGLFVIVFGIGGFIVSKELPIPLTEDEIVYYTNQAKIAYYEGIFYLDGDVKFVSNSDGSFDVYSFNESDKKQKISITFLDNGTVETNFYYSYPFLSIRIVSTMAYAFIGFMLFVILCVFVECIKKGMSKLKNSIK